MGASVYSALVPRARAGAHVRAARVLADEGALPSAPPSTCCRRSASASRGLSGLQEAGRAALAVGRMQSGIAYLRRALDEDPHAGERSELLAELGDAEAATGDPPALPALP